MTFGPGFFRLVLAAMVVVTHLSRYRIGITAVMVFFILSGYWVTRMYCEKYRHAPNAPLDFYISRFLRLWPAFAAAVVLALCARWLAGLSTDPSQLYALPMLGIAVHRIDPLGVSWSLDLELQFYLLLPLIVFAADRRLRTTGLVVILISVAAIVFNYRVFFETTFCYLPAFFAGAVIYFRDIKIGRGAAFASLAVFVVVGYLMTLDPFTRGVVTAPARPAQFGRPAAMLWALTLWPFVAWNVRQASSAFDKALGDLSYSLYLTHYPIIAILSELAGRGMPGAMKLVALGLIAAEAVAFYLWIDRPLERWRAAIVRRRLSGPVTPVRNIP